jgi:ADP-ribose pyrophosphatase YjhB (NUDIX family)
MRSTLERLLSTQIQVISATEVQGMEYWGKRCAGCIVLAASTNRFLLPFRSPEVDDPNCWGTWGGAIDGNENPSMAVRREFREESGYAEISSLYPLLVFRNMDSGMVYHNYLMIVPNEFTPVLNWETTKSGWFEFENFPTPLHAGLEALMNDPWSVQTIEYYMQRNFKD